VGRTRAGHERSARVELLTKHATVAAGAPGQGEQPARHDTWQLALMIAGSYREMPGLKLTLAQAARLFGSDAGPCREALECLIEIGELRRRPQGDYVRAR
jgi:hypothetical protein